MMETKDQKPQGTRGQTAACRACGGKGVIEKGVKDGVRQTVRCIQCRGTGQSGGNYPTK